MKFKLNLSERLTLLNLIPKENNFAILRIIRKFTKDLGITDAEHKEFDIVQEGEKISWNVDRGLKEKDFEIGEIANQLIVTALEKLDNEKKLEQVHFTVYEKFIKSEKDKE